MIKRKKLMRLFSSSGKKSPIERDHSTTSSDKDVSLSISSAIQGIEIGHIALIALYC